MFHTNAVEKIKPHISCSAFFLSENLEIYEIMWENVERGAPQITIWHMRCACCITNATNIHSE